MVQSSTKTLEAKQLQQQRVAIQPIHEQSLKLLYPSSTSACLIFSPRLIYFPVTRLQDGAWKISKNRATRDRSPWKHLYIILNPQGYKSKTGSRNTKPE